MPNYPTGPNWGLQHIGPISRTVDDAAIALDGMSAPDERDPYSLPPVDRPFSDALNLPVGRLRVLFAPDLGYAESVDPEVIAICHDAAAGLRKLGHEVNGGNPGWSSPMEYWKTLFVAGVAARLGPFAAGHSDDIEDKLLEFIAEGQRMAPDTYYRAWIAKNDWWQEIRRTFEQYDLVVTPTVACPPFGSAKTRQERLLESRCRSTAGPHSALLSTSPGNRRSPSRQDSQRPACRSAFRSSDIALPTLSYLR